MLSTQILQNTAAGLKNITKCDISIFERDGKVVASTEEGMIGKCVEELQIFVNSPAEGQSLAGYNYFKVSDNNVTEYVVAAKGEDVESYRVGQLAAFNLQTLLVAYKERFDKDNFIKNLLLDNLLLVDIYSRAKKMHINNNVARAVYLISVDAGENAVDSVSAEALRMIFPKRGQDFVTAVDEDSVILVKELEVGDNKEIEQIGQKIHNIIFEAHGHRPYVAFGTVVHDLKFVSASFKEAKMALEVGKIFEPNTHIVNYNKLGIGRLIYQLPMTLCKVFLEEVLKDISLEHLDDETFVTVNKFFENNLNVSETSRQIYIHRNTLVYRLDKLQKLTGLDLRSFDDAIVFKITLMVNQYVKYREDREHGY